MPKLRTTTKKRRPRRRSSPVPVQSRVLRVEAAREMTGYRRWMFDQKRKSDPRFPKPIKLSSRAIGFLESEIVDYICNVMSKERAS